MATIKKAIVRYEHAPIVPSKDGMSYGQAMDLMISEALAKGETLQELSLYFEESDWNVMVSDHHNASSLRKR